MRSALRQFVPDDGESFSEADRAEALIYAAERLERYGWLPVAGSSFLHPHFASPSFVSEDSARAHVQALLPGRDGRVRSELVVVAADLDGEGAAAVLSTAQRLARRAIYESAPGRTVLIGLWGAPRTSVSGFADLARFPGWVTTEVASVLYVTADTTAAPAVRAALSSFENATVTMVTPPEGGREGTSDLERMQRARETAAVVRWADELTDAILTAAAHDDE
ncbi:MAG: hypothetical protein AAFN13_02310 [Bacteroidota bacterium]